MVSRFDLVQRVTTEAEEGEDATTASYGREEGK